MKIFEDTTECQKLKDCTIFLCHKFTEWDSTSFVQKTSPCAILVALTSCLLPNFDIKIKTGLASGALQRTTSATIVSYCRF